ncbi:MAG: ATP-binding protein [Lunatimonas sp.]|uniref:ATP-binding protein n=1 Tax=Lunatimonas sp. TaxID=2060141 RepID=UPI00263B9339|nr:ATP-binding protein [Lunatimonas sp.]MCC5939150.1 ATP-binding protein [Lunatimonas sp.]
MHINRILEEKLAEKVDWKKALILLGPRQVGKSTLVHKLARTLDPNFLLLNGDEIQTQELLSNSSLEFLKAYLGDSKVIVIDEAQRIPNIGLTLKLIIDNFNHVQLIVTGSSSLELASTVKEPLTGRKWEYRIFPVSWEEIRGWKGLAKAMSQLDSLLVFGSYPEILTHSGEKIPLLQNLSSSYLYKDLLNFQGIRKPELLGKLLQALAWQVGSEVSYNELSNTIQADKATVSNYLDLLEKAYILFRLNPYSRNLRSEITSSRKIYFVDNGMRNSIIGNYAPLSSRNDIGQLWENFLMAERQKLLNYHGFYGRTYFWRTVKGQEVDYIEEIDGEIHAFEFKWSPKSKGKIPDSFIKTYHPKTVKIVHRENYWEWLSTYPYS